MLQKIVRYDIVYSPTDPITSLATITIHPTPSRSPNSVSMITLHAYTVKSTPWTPTGTVSIQTSARMRWYEHIECKPTGSLPLSWNWGYWWWDCCRRWPSPEDGAELDWSLDRNVTSPSFLVEFAHARSTSPLLDFLCFQNKRGLVVGISVMLIPATIVVVPGVYTNEVPQYLS